MNIEPAAAPATKAPQPPAPERRYVRTFEHNGRTWECTQILSTGMETVWSPGLPPPGAPFWEDYFVWEAECITDFARSFGICHRVIVEAFWLGFRLRSSAASWAEADDRYLIIDFSGDPAMLAQVRDWAMSWDVEALALKLVHARLTPAVVDELRRRDGLAVVEETMLPQARAIWAHIRDTVLVSAATRSEPTH